MATAIGQSSLSPPTDLGDHPPDDVNLPEDAK
jgi:hypothetical protein